MQNLLQQCRKKSLSKVLRFWVVLAAVALLLVLACRAAVCACAALEVQRSALAEALWAAVAAVLALSSTRATNCSYRVGGRSSEPPSVGRVA